MVGRNKCDQDAQVADLRHTTEISCSMRTLCPAEDYGDNLSEGEPCEPSDVHHGRGFDAPNREK
jgi:hypothetical protein